ncbi:uncharacterized protein LOC134830357 [Culicoides brevitarsis]|uniref:uncharacterized protein LOC134830357 n=1 Tax=Culicoides brevitarsis TaxID=469753 RepID=UPI00307C5873
MNKINNSYESSDSCLSSGSDTTAPRELNKTLEKLNSGKATVNELLIPATMDENLPLDDENEEIVRSSASPEDDGSHVSPFKSLKIHPEMASPEIENQDVKIREYLNARTSAIKCDVVNEETIAEPTVVPSFSGNTSELSFQGKIADLSIFGPKSPEDLFDDFDDEDFGAECEKSDTSANTSGLTTTSGTENDDDPFRKILTNESRLLKRMQRSLQGVLPPPSVTTSSKITISELLERYHANSKLTECEKIDHETSLFQPNCDFDEISKAEWPESRKIRSLGVCYNLSRNTEKIEMIALDLVSRYVGCETISSYTTTVKSPQSTKKRAMRSKAVMQSPGRRLSHLARRRAIFSSANLKQGVGVATAANRQIVLNPKGRDQKKLFLGGIKVGRTPNKRKNGTPSKRKTPRSSKKKREVIVIKSTITREQSKRALFQSPALTTTEPPKPTVSEDVAKRVEKSKRALFSPAKKLDRSASFNGNSLRLAALSSDSGRYKSMNNLDQVLGGKRKRVDDENSTENWSKIPRLLNSSNAENECPSSSSSRIVKSQSFHVASQLSHSRSSLYRSQTDISDTKKLSEHHKQKLLWAVATALKNKSIISSHPDYKKHASNLTRIVKTLFLQLSDADPQIASISSTSEKLKRIANNHVFSVIKGISYDIIIAKERERIENLRQFKKLEGYVAPDEYKAAQNFNRRHSTQIDSVESSIFSQSFSQISTTTGNLSQMSSLSQIQAELAENVGKTSSSKKNGDNFALKENQRSTQKSQTKQKIQAAGTGNVLKAKRQISFDN